MVLIFNSLSSPETKKQQHIYYLWQAQKNQIMQWLHPPFPEGSLVVRDKQQSPHPPPPPPPNGEKLGTLAEIFAKIICFLKEKKRHGILVYIKQFMFHKGLGWDRNQGRGPFTWRWVFPGVGFNEPGSPELLVTVQPPTWSPPTRARNPTWLQIPRVIRPLLSPGSGSNRGLRCPMGPSGCVKLAPQALPELQLKNRSLETSKPKQTERLGGVGGV